MLKVFLRLLILFVPALLFKDGISTEYNHAPSDIQKMFQSSETIYLESDVDLGQRDSGIPLNCSIVGNGHKISVSGVTNDLFLVTKPGVVIKDVNLENNSTSPTSNRRVVYGQRNNITIMGCTINGALFFAPSSGVRKPLENIRIEKCIITCDFSHSVKDSHNQNDVITLRAVHNAWIKRNVINARDANRVFKTCRGWGGEDSSACTTDIVIADNTISSYSDCGKQFWDMYDGTVNASFVRNVVECFGHTYCFENKTTLDNGVDNDLLIEKNTIITDWKLFFLNTNPLHDSMVFRKNSVVIAGKYNDVTDAKGYHKTRDYFAVIGGVKSLVLDKNIFERDIAFLEIGSFFIQSSSKDITIKRNTLNGFGSMAISGDADVDMLSFRKNKQTSVGTPECEVKLNGIVRSLQYQSPGYSHTAIIASNKGLSSVRKLEVKPGKTTAIALQFPKSADLKADVVKITGTTKKEFDNGYQYTR